MKEFHEAAKSRSLQIFTSQNPILNGIFCFMNLQCQFQTTSLFFILHLSYFDIFCSLVSFFFSLSPAFYGLLSHSLTLFSFFIIFIIQQHLPVWKHLSLNKTWYHQLTYIKNISVLSFLESQISQPSALKAKTKQKPRYEHICGSKSEI